jgi:hypothetical protein
VVKRVSNFTSIIHLYIVMLSQAEGSRSVLRELDRRRFTIGSNDPNGNSHIQQLNSHTIKKDKFAKPVTAQRFSMGGPALNASTVRESVGPQRPVQFRSASSVQQQQSSAMQDVVMTDRGTGAPVPNGNTNGFATPRMARYAHLYIPDLTLITTLTHFCN